MNFTFDDQHYCLRHNNVDDSRSVVVDGSTEELVGFDSSLNVLKLKTPIGRLRVNRADEWTLVMLDNQVKILGVKCNDYHWHQMALAEVAAAKALL